MSNFRHESKKSLFLLKQKLIGWDIAIKENGPVIVEGNGCPQAFNTIQYLYSTISGGLGYRKQWKDILSYLK